MTMSVDVLEVMDPERQFDVRQSTKNANAGFVDWRDWCAYLGRSAEARAAVAELIEALEGLEQAYCRAGSPLDRAERMEDRKRLIAARSALARVKGA